MNAEDSIGALSAPPQDEQRQHGTRRDAPGAGFLPRDERNKGGAQGLGGADREALDQPEHAPTMAEGTGQEAKMRLLGPPIGLRRTQMLGLLLAVQARLAPSRAAGRAASSRSTSSAFVSRPMEQRSVERAGPSSKPIARRTWLG